MHLVITDSGLGGLTICAQLERALGAAAASAVRLTYVNAWPEEGRGYNSLPDLASRARVFDRALRRMGEMRPDAIVIACNTLSILYDAIEVRDRPAIPVHGIVDVGVDLFEEALRKHPAASLVVLGTRTTVESGAHRERLVRRGLAAERIAGVPCHGLATAIEHGPDSADVLAMIDACAATVAETVPRGEPLLAGLCCTHYGMVESRMRASLAAATRREVVTLDPNIRLVEDLTARLTRAAGAGLSPAPRTPAVEVISKVQLNDAQRSGIGAVISRISPATARALAGYHHDPNLF